MIMEHILKFIQRLGIECKIDTNPSLEKLRRIQKRIKENKEKLAQFK